MELPRDQHIVQGRSSVTTASSVSWAPSSHGSPSANHLSTSALSFDQGVTATGREIVSSLSAVELKKCNTHGPGDYGLELARSKPMTAGIVGEADKECNIRRDGTGTENHLVGRPAVECHSGGLISGTLSALPALLAKDVMVSTSEYDDGYVESLRLSCSGRSTCPRAPPLLSPKSKNQAVALDSESGSGNASRSVGKPHSPNIMLGAPENLSPDSNGNSVEVIAQGRSITAKMMPLISVGMSSAASTDAVASTSLLPSAAEVRPVLELPSDGTTCISMIRERLLFSQNLAATLTSSSKSFDSASTSASEPYQHVAEFKNDPVAERRTELSTISPITSSIAAGRSNGTAVVVKPENELLLGRSQYGHCSEITSDTSSNDTSAMPSSVGTFCAGRSVRLLPPPHAPTKLKEMPTESSSGGQFVVHSSTQSETSRSSSMPQSHSASSELRQGVCKKDSCPQSFNPTDGGRCTPTSQPCSGPFISDAHCSRQVTCSRDHLDDDCSHYSVQLPADEDRLESSLVSTSTGTTSSSAQAMTSSMISGRQSHTVGHTFSLKKSIMVESAVTPAVTSTTSAAFYRAAADALNNPLSSAVTSRICNTTAPTSDIHVYTDGYSKHLRSFNNPLVKQGNLDAPARMSSNSTALPSGMNGGFPTVTPSSAIMIENSTSTCSYLPTPWLVANLHQEFYYNEDIQDSLLVVEDRAQPVKTRSSKSSYRQFKATFMNYVCSLRNQLLEHHFFYPMIFILVILLALLVNHLRDANHKKDGSTEPSKFLWERNLNAETNVDCYSHPQMGRNGNCGEDSDSGEISVHYPQLRIVESNPQSITMGVFSSNGSMEVVDDTPSTVLPKISMSKLLEGTEDEKFPSITVATTSTSDIGTSNIKREADKNREAPSFWEVQPEGNALIRSRVLLDGSSFHAEVEAAVPPQSAPSPPSPGTTDYFAPSPPISTPVAGPPTGIPPNRTPPGMNEPPPSQPESSPPTSIHSPAPPQPSSGPSDSPPPFSQPPTSGATAPPTTTNSPSPPSLTPPNPSTPTGTPSGSSTPPWSPSSPPPGTVVTPNQTHPAPPSSPPYSIPPPLAVPPTYPPSAVPPTAASFDSSSVGNSNSPPLVRYRGRKTFEILRASIPLVESVSTEAFVAPGPTASPAEASCTPGASPSIGECDFYFSGHSVAASGEPELSVVPFFNFSSNSFSTHSENAGEGGHSGDSTDGFLSELTSSAVQTSIHGTAMSVISLQLNTSNISFFEPCSETLAPNPNPWNSKNVGTLIGRMFDVVANENRVSLVRMGDPLELQGSKYFVKAGLRQAKLDIFGLNVDIRSNTKNLYFPEERRCVIFGVSF